ncbi:glycosyltransferase family 2 protein, partial [bacterium]|nr:glycosyltransferase family 2 protein [bacterium]
MRVAVVILNWNGKKFLEKFLPAVIKNSKDIAEVIVADNDSKDDSVEFLKKKFPEVRIIINKTNGGFSKGYNDALKQVDADIYILLNSDIEVTENWIRPIINLMQSDESIAACQPKIKSFYSKNEFEYAGAAGGFIDTLGYPFCRGRLFQSIEIDNGQYNDTCEIFWATGACMFVRAEVYHKFGGLDEDFFAHMEEIDFCWRVKNAGYKIMYCADSVIYHVGGGTLPKSSSRKTYLNFRNNLSLLFKNLPANKLHCVMLLRLILDFIAALKFLLNGDFKDAIAVTKAYIHFYFILPTNYKKRHTNKHIFVTKIYKG